MTNYKELVTELNNVLTRSYDAAEGYELAAENSENEIMMDFFEKHALDRRRFIAELTAEIKILDGEPVDSGSFKASLHRTWMNFKELLSSNETEKMVEESIRGEEAAIKEYSELLDNATIAKPDSTNELLRRQRTEIKSALDILSSMLTEVY